MQSSSSIPPRHEVPAVHDALALVPTSTMNAPPEDHLSLSPPQQHGAPPPPPPPPPVAAADQLVVRRASDPWAHFSERACPMCRRPFPHLLASSSIDHDDERDDANSRTAAAARMNTTPLLTNKHQKRPRETSHPPDGAAPRRLVEATTSCSSSSSSLPATPRRGSDDDRDAADEDMMRVVPSTPMYFRGLARRQQRAGPQQYGGYDDRDDDGPMPLRLEAATSPPANTTTTTPSGTAATASCVVSSASRRQSVASPTRAQAFDPVVNTNTIENDDTTPNDLRDSPEKVIGENNDDDDDDGSGPSYYTTHFVEEKRIGRGSFGGVFLCRHVVEGECLGIFAVKKVPTGGDPTYVRAVLREVHLLTVAGRHPNVVVYYHSWVDRAKIADFGPSVRCLFILQEYASEGNLEDYLKSRDALPTLSDLGVWYFFLSAVAGVAHLHHRGILHRDLKPQNLLLTKDDATRPPRLVVADFGTAAMLGEQRSLEERTGATGTLDYMAPELLAMTREDVAPPPTSITADTVKTSPDEEEDDTEKEKVADAPVESNSRERYSHAHTTASDVWALGAILHYLAFGGKLPEIKQPPTTGGGGHSSAASSSGSSHSAASLLPSVVLCPSTDQCRSDEMIGLMRLMLSSDPQRRPTCAAILRNPFIQNLLRQFEAWNSTSGSSTGQFGDAEDYATSSPPPAKRRPFSSRHENSLHSASAIGDAGGRAGVGVEDSPCFTDDFTDIMAADETLTSLDAFEASLRTSSRGGNGPSNHRGRGGGSRHHHHHAAHPTDMAGGTSRKRGMLVVYNPLHHALVFHNGPSGSEGSTGVEGSGGGNGGGELVLAVGWRGPSRRRALLALPAAPAESTPRRPATVATTTPKGISNNERQAGVSGKRQADHRPRGDVDDDNTEGPLLLTDGHPAAVGAGTVPPTNTTANNLLRGGWRWLCHGTVAVPVPWIAASIVGAWLYHSYGSSFLPLTSTLRL